MLQSILDLNGSKTLNKNEQKSINGGYPGCQAGAPCEIVNCAAVGFCCEVGEWRFCGLRY